MGAGRNHDKLKKVSDELCPNVEILIADSDDEDALDQLTQKNKSRLIDCGTISSIWIKTGRIMCKQYPLCRYHWREFFGIQRTH